MRSQVYEWDAARNGGTGTTVASVIGNRTSIFVGGLGNNITKPAETTATEFVVIEDIATTPTLGTLRCRRTSCLRPSQDQHNRLLPRPR